MTDSLIADSADRIFANLADWRELRLSPERAQAELWDAIEKAGLPLAWVPEHLGGVGLELSEGFALVRLAGRYAVPVPLVETMLAGWLLSAAGIRLPPGPVVVAAAGSLALDDQGRISGSAYGVANARKAGHVAALAAAADGDRAVLMDLSGEQLEDEPRLGADGSCSIHFDRAAVVEAGRASPGHGRESLLLMGRVARAVQIAGALEAVLHLAVEYAGERKAFGRTISTFQAIQHSLARLGSETAAAVASSLSAADSISLAGGISSADPGLLLEVLSAKIRTGEAAEMGMATAHQVFGAIGFTYEHPLHTFSQRALAWRDDFGDESLAATELGMALAKVGGDRLWPLLASR